MALFSNVPYVSSLSKAAMLALLGFAAIIVGYFAPVAPRAAQRVGFPRANFAQQFPVGRILTLFAVGAAAQLFIILGVGRTFQSAPDAFSYSGSENLILQLGMFMLYAVAAAALVAADRWRRRRGGGTALLLAMMVGVAAVAVLYVYKFAVVAAAVLILLAVHYRVRWMSFRSILFVAIVVIWVVFPFISTERDLVYARALPSDEPPLVRIQESARRVLGSLRDRGLSGYAEDVWNSVMARSNGIDSLAAIVRDVPQRYRHTHGRDYALLPINAIIPRALWHGKPRRVTEDFPEKFLGRETTTNFGITNLGDLYLNFGGFGVIVGALILGFVYRFVYELLVVRAQASDTALLLYGVVLVLLVANIEAELAPGFAQVVKTTLIVLLLGLWLAARAQAVAIDGRRKARSPVLAGKRVGS
jgi:hypothetical protein